MGPPCGTIKGEIISCRLLSSCYVKEPLHSKRKGLFLSSSHRVMPSHRVVRRFMKPGAWIWHMAALAFSPIIIILSALLPSALLLVLAHESPRTSAIDLDKWVVWPEDHSPGSPLLAVFVPLVILDSFLSLTQSRLWKSVRSDWSDPRSLGETQLYNSSSGNRCF